MRFQIPVGIPLRNPRHRKYRRVDRLYTQRILYAHNKTEMVAHQTHQEVLLCQVTKCRPRRTRVSDNRFFISFNGIRSENLIPKLYIFNINRKYNKLTVNFMNRFKRVWYSKRLLLYIHASAYLFFCKLA